ncbi:MAG TPA: lysophospholipid acyltransferase family protein, partial [Paucimonas sp.]|nr:lysophospholipid acyltransferase family protein [Paucimonas sp.]
LDPKRRARTIQHWSARLVAICGVRIDLRVPAGRHAAEKALIVANHVSWLDIFVINTVQPCRFVAKSDIRDWPLIGWLCMKAGTVFIARGKMRDVRRTFEHLVAALHEGEHVAFFPEGGTAAPGTLRPFHANLFEAAIDAGVPVQPYALQYVDAEGRLHAAADFTGDVNFVQSAFRIARARRMTAQLILLPPIPTAQAHRRELADAARASIAAALGYQD